MADHRDQGRSPGRAWTCSEPGIPAVEVFASTFQCCPMIYVLAYPEFEPHSARQIDRFRSSHEPERAKLVPPHITLVFGLRQADPKGVLTLCESVSGKIPELAVEFSNSKVVYNPFEKTHKLLLLCGKGKDPLIELHNQLYEGLHRAELKSEFPYQPHMTVATHADPRVIEQLDVADIGTLPLTGTIRALELVELVTGKLNCLKTVSLRK
ncbi:2'-5' RNA ligase family protein [Leisingera sp. HS039]|uniref:2'-5' RNA ligase family protein n=1 Tax=unclassified Leisingera TaxID=2614906 RepID=UPI0010708042|nr:MULTISPECIES: 2'-5' RNA ligase family protein [unclassified Leisingera]MBQ4825745.1 2'-5' RNA ligase family protein [Leisingera sp. HS039]QBR37256.1 2'-5' RNA ligase family protein [Leisingera sp. NJS201]